MKYFIIIVLLIFYNNTFSQSPLKMSYQAVIRDPYNNLLSLKDIGIRISILKGSSNGLPTYIETQKSKTNLNGLTSLQIGTGFVVMGKFSDIDWSKGPYFVLTETDPDGGYDYRITGVSELLSVPYALYAANSNASIDTTNIHNSIVDLQKQAIINKNNIQTNIDRIIANSTQIEVNLNNIQLNTNNIKNNLDTLNSKISSVDFNALILGYQKVGKFVSSISLEGTDSFDIKINGNLIASKNVTVGGNIESSGATSTLGTLEKPFKGLFISSGSLSIASDTLGQNVPPAVLSNVRGNLEISAGGLKLVGNNQAFIAPRIISTLTGNASTASKLETARTINGVAFDGSNNIVIANANLTGIVTSIGTVTNIASGTITNSMIANTAVSHLIGINTGDQVLPTLESLGASAKIGSSSLVVTGNLNKLLLSSNKPEEQREEIDLTISVHKLSGLGGHDYILNDGHEGQVIYLLPFGNRTTVDDITIRIDNATIWIDKQLVTSNREQPVIWTPFTDKQPTNTLVTAVFTDNRWFLTGGISTIK